MPRKIQVENFGTDAVGLVITGDPKNQEPNHFRIAFPGGDVEVTRARDGENADYWVHVRVNKPDTPMFVPDETLPARITDARLDIIDKATSKADKGDFDNPNLYHFAVRVTPEPIKVPWYKRGLKKDDQA
jgi:hypothetical protein